MGVIIESQPGDSIVFISNAVICEDGKPFNWESSKEFKIGDIVSYVDFFKNEKQSQEYISWFIKFKDRDGKIYSAVQTYFVTMEEWEQLEKHFENRLK